jgi:hypothetical protein
MAVLKRKRSSGGPFTFRVSDVVTVPLRGTLLRLRLVDGEPLLGDLGVGSELLLRGGAGSERRVRIAAHSVTGGRPSQKRLDRTREFDVILTRDDAAEPVEIGWLATGPVE